jgi:hypothetical protein
LQIAYKDPVQHGSLNILKPSSKAPGTCLALHKRPVRYVGCGAANTAARARERSSPHRLCCSPDLRLESVQRQDLTPNRNLSYQAHLPLAASLPLDQMSPGSNQVSLSISTAMCTAVTIPRLFSCMVFRPALRPAAICLWKARGAMAHMLSTPSCRWRTVFRWMRHGCWGTPLVVVLGIQLSI